MSKSLDEDNKSFTDESDLKAFLLAFAFFLVIFLALFSPTTFTGHLLCTEVPNINCFFGPSEFWTDTVYSGFPWIALPEAMTFYPPAMLMRLNGETWNIFVTLAFVLSGAFMFSFARMVTRSNFAGLIAGIAFSLGYITNEITHFSMLHTFCWTIGSLFFLERFARKPDGLNFASGATAIALCGLAGHPQTFSYALGLWIFYIGARTTTLEKGQQLRYAGFAMSMVLLGSLVAGLQLFQTAELASFSARENFSFKDFLTYSANPMQVVGVFMPYIFGGAPDGIIGQPAFSNFLVFCSDYYYGFIVLILSLSAIFALRKDRMVVFWGLLGLLSFLVSFGDATPLAWLMYHVPPYGSFRAVYRMLLISSMANAILAALCVKAIEDKQLPLKTMMKVMAWLAGLFLMLVFELPTFGDLLRTQSSRFGVHNLGLLPWTNPSIGVPCVMFALSIVACILYQRYQNKMTRATILLVLLADLGFCSWYSFGAEWRIAPVARQQLNEPASGTKYRKLCEASGSRMLTIRGGSATFDELKTNLDQIWGIQQASGYGPLIPKRYGELLNMTEGGFLIPPFHYKAEDRCFDILSIKYATSAAEDSRLEEIKNNNKPNWKKIEVIGTASIHENLNALPRCWLVGNVTRSTPKQILRGIKTSVLNSSERFNPLETALIEESPPPTWKNQSAPDKGTQQLNAQGEFKEKLDSRAGGTDSKNCQIISLTDKEVILETDSTKPSFLVVSEIYYPGWKATIDNRPAEIYKTDYVLRGLFVDKGKHRIIFSFEPTRLKPALFLALVAILLIILSAFFIDRKVGKTDVE
jgi:hypothetical protein